MRYPLLTEIPTTRDMVDAFGGYNHNLRIGSGEFYDMQNLTSAHYPILSPRGKRGVYEPATTATALISKDGLCYVDGGNFVINGESVRMGLTDTPKQLVSMGAYVVIFPDKKYINTAHLSDWGSLETTVTTQEGSGVTYYPCTLDGSPLGNVHIDDSAPTNPQNGDKWMDTSSTPHSLKVYSSSQSVWTSISTTYIKIACPNIAIGLSQYDGVTISGINATMSEARPATQLNELNGQTSVLWKVYRDEDGGGVEDYIVVIGLLDENATQAGGLTITRTVPEMDFVIECGNRLWGCKYGSTAEGKVVNEIYASKLGDFKNWNCFMGLSTDSYAVSVGTDGKFTGAATHLGYPLFFKEGFLHKVYGNYPANYQIQTTACSGVQDGSGKSLAIVNEVLYYKSRMGVCAYDGSLPTEMSTVFGDVAYFDAVAGAHGNKYYISMADRAGKYHLFVYDTAKGMWHKEDNTRVDAFCPRRNEMYYIDNKDGKIKTMFGSGTADTAPVKWMAQTGILGVDSPDKKYISRLNIRIGVDVGTCVHFYIQYDSMGDWEHIYTLTGNSVRSYNVPIRPRRCDHMRLRIVGEGDAKLFSICKTVEQGSDF